MFRKMISNKAAVFALPFITMVAFSSVASAEEIILSPENSFAKELPDNAFLKLAQAEETAVEKAKRIKEERQLERKRKRAERARKRNERLKKRPRFGSFS